MSKGKSSFPVHKVHNRDEFSKINRELNAKRYVAIDALKPGLVRDISLAQKDAANAGAQDMAVGMGCGAWSNGPLSKVAWSFDSKSTESVVPVFDKDGNDLGQYVKWGAGDNIPSVIPPLAMSSPYTAAPLRYIADLTTGLGVHLMYRMPDGELVEYKDAGELLQQQIDKLEKEEGIGDPTEQQLLEDGLVAVGQEPRKKESKALKRLKEMHTDWERSWFGFDVTDQTNDKTHVPGAKEFLDENNLDLHMSQCMQDNVMLDIYFPTIGLQRGRAKAWDYPVKPRIIRCDALPAHSCRLSVKNTYGHINSVYYSDSLRRKGAIETTSIASASQDNSFKKYPCAMPQHLLSEINYLVEDNKKTRIKARPTWIVCPTFYPSLNKPYYPQPAWWSVFTSKAFDFSATVLYDKYKQRDNNTTFSRCYYVSLDYLNQVFSDEGYLGNQEKQQEFIDQLDQSMENFLQHRENTGKAMRQWMWVGPDGKEHHNVEVVDFKDTTNDAVKAGKEELELSTSPIFLALQIDPRLVGVPMVAASNGGTALREMHLLKQQQLSIHKRSYERFMNAIATYNEWSRAEFHVIEQTLTTLDNSKTGTVEIIASEGA